MPARCTCEPHLLSYESQYDTTRQGEKTLSTTLPLLPTLSFIQEDKALITKAVLLIFSIIGTIAGVLGIFQIRVSTTAMVIRANCTQESMTISQVLHPKPRASCMVEAEIEKDDSYDINLLRFTGAFGFVYLAFLLLAGIDYVSTNNCNPGFCANLTALNGTGVQSQCGDCGYQLLRPEGWVTIMMGILGFAEISFIITFLAHLKRKVTYSMKILYNQTAM